VRRAAKLGAALLGAVLAGELAWFLLVAPPRAPIRFDLPPGEGADAFPPAFRTAHRRYLEAARDEDTAAAWERLGNFHFVAGHLGRAAAAYRRALARDQESFAGLGRAFSLDRLGHLDAAAEAYRRLVEGPGADDAQLAAMCTYRIARIHLRAERVDDARRAFARCLESDPDFDPASLELARLAIRARDHAAFTPHYERLRSRHRRTVEVYHLALRAEDAFAPAHPIEVPPAPGEKPLQGFVIDHVGWFRDTLRRRIEAEAGEGLPSDPAARERALRESSHDRAAIAAGRTLYARRTCVACHGPDGYGGTGPNLRDEYWLHGSDATDVVASIASGRAHGAMPAQAGRLTPSQIHDLAAFVIDRNRDTETRADGSTTQGRPPQGRRDPVGY